MFWKALKLLLQFTVLADIPQVLFEIIDPTIYLVGFSLRK
jgi:hypothetical protein